MAQKISEMNPVVTPALTDQLEDAQSGAPVSRRISLQQIYDLFAFAVNNGAETLTVNAADTITLTAPVKYFYKFVSAENGFEIRFPNLASSGLRVGDIVVLYNDSAQDAYMQYQNASDIAVLPSLSYATLRVLSLTPNPGSFEVFVSNEFANISIENAANPNIPYITMRNTTTGGGNVEQIIQSEAKNSANTNISAVKVAMCLSNPIDQNGVLRVYAKGNGTFPTNPSLTVDKVGLLDTQIQFSDTAKLIASMQALQITGAQDVPELKLVVPNTNGAQFDLVNLTNYSILANIFPDTATSYVYLQGVMPKRWNGAGMRFVLKLGTGATTGVALFKIDAAVINGNQSYDASFGTAIDVQVTANATANVCLDVDSGSSLVVPSGTLTANTRPFVVFRIYRVPGDAIDTLVGNVYLSELSYRYTSNQGNDA
jgi:hypothetical protein